MAVGWSWVTAPETLSRSLPRLCLPHSVPWANGAVPLASVPPQLSDSSLPFPSTLTCRVWVPKRGKLPANSWAPHVPSVFFLW